MVLQPPSLRAVFVRPGVTKLQDIVVRLTGTHSVRFIQAPLREIQNVVPDEVPAVGEWEEGQGVLLTLKTLQLSTFNGKKCQQEGTLSGV